MQAKHENTGACQKCNQIISRYPDFNSKLLGWFKDFQEKNPEAHTSCAGRGEDDQDAFKLRGASKASWGQSAHNYNAALDLFVNLPGKDIYDYSWFIGVLAQELPDWITWYGRPGAPFYELPHVELSNWSAEAHLGNLKLVE
jgi:ribonucleotide monophosphatase NagD (HAD superfamily)